MSNDPDLSSILDDLAAGRIDAAEAARRIDAAEAARGIDAVSASAPARASEQRDVIAPAPAPEPVHGQAIADEAPAEPPSAPGNGAERVSIRTVGRRVRLVGDAAVATVAVTGPHVLRRSGQVFEITSEVQGNPLDGLNLLRLPRSVDELLQAGLGPELVVRINPRLAVDVEVTGAGLGTEGVPRLGRVRVTAGTASVAGVAQVTDLLVQAGSASVSGTFAGGRSKLRCESGGLTVHLDADANVTVRGTAQMGRITWPGDTVGQVDEWIVGNGSGRLDVEVVAGLGTIKEA